MPRCRCFSSWALLGLLVGSGIVTICLIGPSGSEANAAPLSVEGTAVFQTTDKIVVSVPLAARTQDGTLTVAIMPADKKAAPLAQTEIKVKAGQAEQVRVELPAVKGPTADLSLACRLGKDEFTVPLKNVLLVKAHETTLNAGTTFHANSEASLRLGVHGVKSLTETVPLADAAVNVRLLPKDGKPIALYEGKTGADGMADVRFKMPALADGTYKLEIVTKSPLGEEKLERDITVTSLPKSCSPPTSRSISRGR